MLRAVGLNLDRLTLEQCDTVLKRARQAGLNAAVWLPTGEAPPLALRMLSLRHYLYFPEPPPVDRLLELHFEFPDLAGFITSGDDPQLRDFAVATECRWFHPEEFPLELPSAELPVHWRRPTPGAGVWADRDYERGWLLWHAALTAIRQPQLDPAECLSRSLAEVFGLEHPGPAAPFDASWLTAPQPPAAGDPSHRHRELTELYRSRRQALILTGVLFAGATRGWSTLYALQSALVHDFGLLRLAHLQLRRSHGVRIDPEELTELEKMLD